MLLAALSALAASLPDPNAGESVGWFFVAGGGAALTLNQALGVMERWKRLKRPEPLPVNAAEAKRIESLESDMRELELRMERRLGESLGSINSRMGALETTISHLVGDFSRALGVLEGKAEAAKR
jgi:hypothetical protein